MKIAIVDDERAARSELVFLLKCIWPYAEYIEADSGEAAKRIFDENKFNIIFLDINLGDISGVTLASYLRTTQPKAGVIFVTAYEEYAVKAFGLDVVDYILKPFDLERLKQIVGRLDNRGFLGEQDRKTTADKLAVRGNESIILIEQEKIVFIEASQKNCLIHTLDKTYEENSSLTSLLSKLNENEFYRVQKSYAVNLNFIKEIIPSYNHGYALKMEGYESELIPVSRNEVKNIKSMFVIN